MRGRFVFAFGAVLTACGATEPSVPPPPPSGWIYFAEGRRMLPHRKLRWRIRPDGTGRAQVPNPDEVRAGPEFDVSRDGRVIAVNRSSALMVVPSEAPEQSYLLSRQDRGGNIRLAPSGQTVANTRIDIGASGRWQLLLTPLDGSPESILAESTRGLWALEWFPDGDSLAYFEGGAGVRVLRLRDLTSRPHTTGLQYFDPSPSGHFGITFTVDSIDHDTKKHWRLYDLSTGQIVREVTHRFSPHRLAWSPDERHFVDLCQELSAGLEFLGLCVYDRATLLPITRLADPTPDTYLDYPRWIP